MTSLYLSIFVTALSFTGLTAIAAECKKWCAGNDQTWEVKCAWTAACGKCFECLMPQITTRPAKNCRQWCLNKPMPWREKCSWLPCQLCDECGGWFFVQLRSYHRVGIKHRYCRYLSYLLTTYIENFCVKHICPYFFQIFKCHEIYKQLLGQPRVVPQRRRPPRCPRHSQSTP